MTPVPDPYADTSVKRKITLAIAGVLGAVGLLLAILFQTGVLRLGMNTGGPVLAQKGEGPAPVLAKKVEVPAPVLPKTADRGPQMPEDVRAYLKWVETIEDEKSQLLNRQATQMQTFKATLSVGGLGSAADVENMASPDGTFAGPLNDLAAKIDVWKKEWYALEERFRSVTPPQECLPLRDAFGSGLGQIGGQMADVGRTFAALNPDQGDVRDEANQSIERVNEIKSGHKGYVDNALAKADEEVGAICARYSERKWFSIDAQGKMGNLLGL